MHGSDQSNEQAVVALAGGSCRVSVAKLPGTQVEAHLVMPSCPLLSEAMAVTASLLVLVLPAMQLFCQSLGPWLLELVLATAPGTSILFV